jgi:hypothetical protein
MVRLKRNLDVNFYLSNLSADFPGEPSLRWGFSNYSGRASL